MKIKIFGQTYEGTAAQFRQLIKEIDIAPETRSLPERKRELVKYELERELRKAAQASGQRGAP